MLEAFQSLREELATQKKVEVESSLLASKPGSSSNNAAHLDLPPPRSGTNLPSEAMDVDYGPALSPRLVPTHPHAGLLFLENKPSQIPRGMLGVNKELLFNKEVISVACKMLKNPCYLS